VFARPEFLFNFRREGLMVGKSICFESCIYFVRVVCGPGLAAIWALGLSDYYFFKINN